MSVDGREPRAAARVALHVVLPLALGTLAYAAYRSRSGGADVPLVAWLARVGATDAARATIGRAPLPRAIGGALPDLAWAWAFGAALSLVWRNQPIRDAAPWLAAGALAAIGAEVAQAAGLVAGTFDVLDVVAIGVGYALGAIVARRRRSVS